MERFRPISTRGLDGGQLVDAMTFNALGSLWYFVFVVLRRRRLTENLHLPFCQTLERDHIKDVIEMPRDHFKTTCASEGLPMWKALPFQQKYRDMFASAGYSDTFIRWLLRSHNPDIRNLIVSENITNAAKIGRRIRWHFESNALYRGCFPETLFDTSCTWTDYSLHVKHAKHSIGGGHGEGTFDFLGVGSALQSRHYDFVIQDDLVGRKAIESQSIMDKTIEYHQLLCGAFDDEDKDHENDELVVGNRWSYLDLNSHLREHEAWFRFESHGALGGCCGKHPIDTPIFPEEWTFEKLMRRKARLGSFNFSCQYLNNPSAPENADFKVEWLNYFELKHSELTDWVVEHEVKDGIVRKDLTPKHFTIKLIVDPNHSGNAAVGRCRHAVLVVGQDDSDQANFYLLETWAAAASYDAFYDKIFELAMKWHLHRIGVETVAAQKFVKHHIEHLAMIKGWRLTVDELKGEVEAPDGTLSKKKEWRIRNVLSPIAEFGRLFVQRKQQDFINEYQTFPKGKYVDQLDALAYVPQMMGQRVSEKQHMEMLMANQEAMARLGHPYSAGVGRYNA